jgi:hypothetical protein
MSIGVAMPKHTPRRGRQRAHRPAAGADRRAKGFTNKACAFFGEAVHEDKSLYIDALKDARISGNATNYVRQMLSFLRRTADANTPANRPNQAE